jgi:uncharacterized protein (TIGR02246 family)
LYSGKTTLSAHPTNNKTRSIKTLAILATITTVIFMACSPREEKTPAVDMEKAKTEIQALENTYAAAELAKDAAGVAAYYAEDAVSYNRNKEPTIGRAAIQERIAKRIAADTSGNKPTYTVVDIFADGNQLVEIGSFLQANLAGLPADKGYYMSCFEKRDGKYQCVRDMGVTTLPAK